jgi:hypothetical protein
MKNGWGLLLAVSLVTTPVLAQKIHIDYDQEAAFGTYKTFQYKPTPEMSVQDSAPLMHDRLIAELTRILDEGGLQQVDADPDLYVTYHTSEKEEMQLNTTSFGYGYGPSFYWDPYWSGGGAAGSSTTTAQTYTRGTLVIDIWDAEKVELVWRGTASAVVPENPQKGEKLIQKTLKKMVRKWEKMRAKDQKRRAKES